MPETPGQHDALVADAERVIQEWIDDHPNDLGRPEPIRVIADLAAALRTQTAETAKRTLQANSYAEEIQRENTRAEAFRALLTGARKEIERLGRLLDAKAGSGCEWVETSDDGTSYCALAEARAAAPTPLWRGVTDELWMGDETNIVPDASWIEHQELAVPPGTEVAVYKIEGGGNEAPCVPGSPSDASKATTVVAPTPEPLWAGQASALNVALDHGGVRRALGVPHKTEIRVYRADQTPAGVTRGQVREALYVAGLSEVMASDTADAIMALLRGEGSDDD